MIEIIDVASLHGPVLVEGDTRNAITWALGKASQLWHFFYVLNINGYLAIHAPFCYVPRRMIKKQINWQNESTEGINYYVSWNARDIPWDCSFTSLSHNLLYSKGRKSLFVHITHMNKICYLFFFFLMVKFVTLSLQSSIH